jgi:hypothetical protein
LLTVEQVLGVRGEELHGEVHASELAALDRQIARHGRSAAQSDGVEFLAQLLGGEVLAHLGVGTKRHALVGQQLDPALDDALVELHGRDAVHHQTTDAIGALEHRDLVAGPIELGGAGQTRRARAHHGDLLAGAKPGRACHHPALGEGAIGDGCLVDLDGDRRRVDAKHARALARRGHTRPVTSGKLLVRCKRSMASRQRPR